MPFTPEQTKLLDAPLNSANVKPPSQYGPKGHYIEGWHTKAEANRIFGFDGWSYEIIDSKCVSQGAREIGKSKDPGFGVTYTAQVKVSVEGVVREDFGAGHGYDRDCGLAHESAIKEAVTDALKRALSSFGNQFGLALYDKTRANVTDEPLDHTPPFVPDQEAYAFADATIDGFTRDIDLRAYWTANKDKLPETVGNELTAVLFTKVRSKLATLKEAA